MSHADNATQFLADPNRAHWHDQALWFVRAKRDLAARSLPEWESLRSLASQIKQHTVAQLDEYLVQFERNATAAGAQVHWARTPSEHNEIVLSILRAHRITAVVKSKSMLTEECGLNEFLTDHKVTVTDTDLGEWIVQLREEPPSHIVLPAIHLRKEDVGRLFHQKLGTPAEEIDPAALTEAARHQLRKSFLSAGAGITGVNFAVAETGGIVVCTNEGNADLGTSLPPVHIACMGLEKLVPRLIDLGVFTRLLARSATGQPITAYTSHFRGPRPGGALHVVILDNGRSRLLANAEYRDALKCIRCGACLNTCPVYRRSGGHSYQATVAGPIGSVLHAFRDPKGHGSLPFACSLCGSCRDICPVQIDLPQQLLSLRRDIVRSRDKGTLKKRGMWCATQLLRSPMLYQWASYALRWFLHYAPSSLRARLSLGWSRQRGPLPIADRTFRDSYRSKMSDASTAKDQGDDNRA